MNLVHDAHIAAAGGVRHFLVRDPDSAVVQVFGPFAGGSEVGTTPPFRADRREAPPSPAFEPGIRQDGET